jgi:hypothetical protein
MLFIGKWLELENIMLSEISKAQKIKGHLVSLFCGSQTYKINAHINTYMILTTHTHTHTHTHTQREHDLLVGLSEETTGRWEKEREC